MNQKQAIIEKVKQLAGNSYLFLDTAIEVKITPHSPSVNIWALCISPDDSIYLMDADEHWHELEETDLNYSLILATVYQRVNTIYKQFLAA